ncbi:MAG: hypothetical protein J6K20_03155 [Thermoguttaceae bacterium]|nr:hypothetical protein [Thermoguttaceae bacterium]
MLNFVPNKIQQILTKRTNDEQNQQNGAKTNKREQTRVATRILWRLGRGSVGVDPIGLDASALGVNDADQREAETEFERQLG